MKIRTGQRVAKVVAGAGGFEVVVAGGERVATRQVTAATSGFGAPYRLASSELKWSRVWCCTWRDTQIQRVRGQAVRVGAGSSVVQIGHELAAEARVTLTSRKPVWRGSLIVGSEPRACHDTPGGSEPDSRVSSHSMRSSLNEAEVELQKRSSASAALALRGQRGSQHRRHHQPGPRQTAALALRGQRGSQLEQVV